MSAPGQHVPDSRTRTAAIALAVTLAIQMFTALAATSTSVLAPVIGRDLAVAPKLIGVFVGIVYAGSMAASLASGMFIERYGAIRVSQVCVLLCATGALMVAGGTVLPGTAILALAVAPLVIGLGYGPITPASSHVLARTAPPSRMALTFSIKQTGVPAGAALAGAMLPLLALQIGWRATLTLVAAAGIAIALTAQLVRAMLDTGRKPAPMPSFARIVAPLRHILRTPVLAELAIVAFVYAALQVCLMSFLVVYLTESLGYSLVAAGLALTVANLGGIVGRILWGAVADFHVAPRTLLGLIGMAAGACAWSTAAFGAALADRGDPRAVQPVRRDGHRMERGSARRGRAKRAGGRGGRHHRRGRFHHVRRRRDRTADVRADRGPHRRISHRICGVRRSFHRLRPLVAGPKSTVSAYI